MRLKSIVPALSIAAVASAALSGAAIAQNAAAGHAGHAGHSAAQDPTRAPVGASASAPLTNAEGASAGSVTFRQGPAGLVLRIEATGLTPGWHGVHLHETGACDGPGFTSAGAHVHGGGEQPPHGLLNAEGRDDGDLPNIYADAEGRAFAEVFTPFARLAETGPGVHLLDADGSSIVIHASPDDYVSQPIGGSGARVACGVIKAN